MGNDCFIKYCSSLCCNGCYLVASWGWKKRKSCLCTSGNLAYLGVTELALFGINIEYVYPFVAGMIGSAFAGMISVAMDVTAFNIGVGGLPGFLSIQSGLLWSL